MLDDIIFITGFVMLAIGLLGIYKSPNRISILRSIVICIITELCMGTVIAGIYSVIGVPIDLITMGIGFGVLALITYVYIFKSKKIQKYNIEKVDIYTFSVLSIFFVLLFLKTFTSGIKLVYSNTDPANHYLMAKNVLTNKKVSGMYFAPLYNGLMMELMQPFIKGHILYKAFAISDALFNYLNLLMFYVLATTISKSKMTKILTPFICILYFLGWPVYSWVGGGFVYFGIGVTVFAYIVYLLSEIDRNEWDKKLWIAVALGIYNLSICYMLFVPIIAIVMVLYIIYMIRKNKVAISFKIWLTTSVVLALFGCIIFCVCFFGFFRGDWHRIIRGLGLDGGIHKQLYEDFIFLCPPVIYILHNYIVNKKVNIIILTLETSIGVTLLAFIMVLLGIMSGYYYYKLYYILWILAFLVCEIALEQIAVSKKNIALYAYGLPIILVIINMWLGVTSGQAFEGLRNSNTKGILPIYEESKACTLQQDESRLEDKECLIDICEYILQNYSERDDISLITSYEKGHFGAWYRAFTGYSTKVAYHDSLIEILDELEENEYFVMQQSTDAYWGNEELFDKYEHIYDNGYYGLYRTN